MHVPHGEPLKSLASDREERIIYEKWDHLVLGYAASADPEYEKSPAVNLGFSSSIAENCGVPKMNPTRVSVLVK